MFHAIPGNPLSALELTGINEAHDGRAL